jgi:pilus assembly protein CpaE
MNERSRASAVNGAAGPESANAKPLTAAVLSATEKVRRALTAALEGAQAEVIREAPLPGLEDLAGLLEDRCDVLIVDIDDQPEPGLRVVEAACALDPAMTVMVYGTQTDSKLLVRCMRAGAREFLNEPLSSVSVAEALVRAAARREEVKTLQKTRGKILVFVGAKGGSGVTTVAANVAVALARESGQSVALVDLNLHLGDAALTLGLASEFSTLDALQNERRLDSELVSKLFVRHSSGLKVLPAPSGLTSFQPAASGILKLIQILRGDFAWVVVDAGSQYGAYTQSLFDVADRVYLVAQVSVTDLRNSHLLIQSHFQKDDRRKLEVVLNRFSHRAGEIDAGSIEKALTVAPNWKVPSDFHAVRRAQNTAAALVSRDSPVARVLTSMARAACGNSVTETRKRRFSLFA